MPKSQNRRWWRVAVVVMLALGSYLGAHLWGEDRRLFLPNATSHGHYQIEIACTICHTPFNGVKQDACNRCHGEELEAANDSHPRKKFEDPRNADRLTVIDARRCVTCHVEHQPERTRAMGVTQPDDVCFHCHADIAKDRPSHANLSFDGCAAAGCHNFHDNTALYEDFLVKHLNEPKILARPRFAPRHLAAWMTSDSNKQPPRALSRAEADAPPPIAANVLAEWAGTRHAQRGVNCRDCHAPRQPDGRRADWQDKPGPQACRGCHGLEQQGFESGRHGMRLAQQLSPLRPELARLPMQPDAQGRELGCSSCHAAHRFNTRTAAVEACLECHDDIHSRSYRDSPHARLWRAEQDGQGGVGSGVSCASCHLPRLVHREGDLQGVRVQHNQNDNLRPNEKMLRGVCMHCHGLGFSIDALADAELVANNFSGSPAAHVESLDMAAARLKQPRKPKP